MLAEDAERLMQGAALEARIHRVAVGGIAIASPLTERFKKSAGELCSRPNVGMTGTAVDMLLERMRVCEL